MQGIWDWGSWIVAVPTALLLRYDFEITPDLAIWALVAGFLAGMIQIVAGSIFHLYQGRYVIGSFDEVLGVIVTTLFVGGLATFMVFILPSGEFPRSTFIIATGIATSAMLGARFLYRGARQQRALNRKGKRTLIYGAGDAGSQIVTLMLNDRYNEYQPIGFIDDDPRKHHLRRSGIKVDTLWGPLMRFSVLLLPVSSWAVWGLSSFSLFLGARFQDQHSSSPQEWLLPACSALASSTAALGNSEH